MVGNGDEDDTVDSEAIVERTVIGNEGKLKNQTNADATTILANLRTLIIIGHDIAGLLRCIICVCLIGVGVLLLMVSIEINK